MSKKNLRDIIFQDVENRTIFVNDNLNVMQKMDDKVVDLIYLDPPFGNMLTWKATNREKITEIKNYFLELQQTKNLFADENFEEIFKDVAFDDTWKETDVNKSWQEIIIEYDEKLFTFIDSVDFTLKGGKYYLFYMAIRLIEMKRILKDTGSIYLHCDNTMGHYLKSIMDILFGYENFRNAITWERIKGAGKRSQFKIKNYGTSTDIIFFYTKSNLYFFDGESIKIPFSEEYINKHYKFKDEKGRYQRRNPFRNPALGERPNLCYEYKGFRNPHSAGWLTSKERLIEIDKSGELEIVNNKIYRKLRLEKTKGIPINNIWEDIVQTMGNEKVGYPTQKPLPLLERIIKASSKKGDIVLDPFCGCATTLIAAEGLDRKWIGIDKNRQAFYMNYYRMRNKLKMVMDTEDRQDTLFDNTSEILKETKDVSLILTKHLKKPCYDLPILSDREAEKEKNKIIAERKKKDEKYREYLKNEARELKGEKKKEYRENLRKQQNNTCKVCKTKLYDAFHLDRIISGSQGGQYVEGNLQILCTSCNLSKNKGANIALIDRLFKMNKIDVDVYKINIDREFSEGRISETQKNNKLDFARYKKKG